MKKFFLLFVGVVFALVFAMSRIQVLHLQYEVTQLKQQLTDLTEGMDRLRMDVARQKAPTTLEQAAQRLGLRVPSTEEVLYLDE